MTPTLFSQSRHLLALALILGLTSSSFAQQRSGGGNSNRRSSSSSSSRNYPSSGEIGDAYFSIDPESRRVVTIADEDTTKYISQVLSNLDMPKPQVLIKVVFLEVNHTKSLDLGVEGQFTRNLGNTWTDGITTNFSGGTVGSTNNVVSSIMPALKNMTMGGGTSYGFPTADPSGVYTVMGQDYTVTLHAIAQAGNAKILSRPSILARNNQPATITVGQSVPLITNVRYDTFGNAINSVTYKDVGVILKVTPFITSDGMVEMIVQPEISSIDKTTTVPISAGVSAPVINIRSADTVAVTPDGQTVVIGGLMSNLKASIDTKIPLLGDIPILGALFKRKQTSDSQTELVIFLTPHIVQAPSQLAALSNKERSKSEGIKSFTDEDLSRYLEDIPSKEMGNGATSKPKNAPKK